MADYVRIFAVTNIATIHGLLADIQILLARAERLQGGSSVGAAATRGRVKAIQAQLSRDLTVVAIQTARFADERMRAKLKAEQKRPDTGRALRLRDVVVSEPLGYIAGFGTGAVGIAKLAELRRAVNPYDPAKRPYWMAIEHGSTAAVGRRLRGWFYDAGPANPTAADPLYSGGAGPHPLFLTRRAAATSGVEQGAKTSGRPPGMTIRHPIRPERFIRVGANEARAFWQEGLNQAQAAALAELAAIGLA